MITGLGISGIASAVRTAGKARATIDEMSRQIATGQRVSSSKDDGAAWVRAAALKSQLAGVGGREIVIAALKTEAALQNAQTLTAREAFAELRDVLLTASQHSAGSPARSALQARFARAIEILTQASAPTGMISSGRGSWPEGWGVQTTNADPLLAGEVVFTLNGAGFGVGGTGWTTYVPPTFSQGLAATDILNGNAAAIQEAIRLSDYWLNDHLPHHEREAADDHNWLERVALFSDRETDRLNAAIGSLTDTDLGKASNARAQAETRQQLALSTVRQAISTYGNFAGGLLGNVQRTQRGIMA